MRLMWNSTKESVTIEATSAEVKGYKTAIYVWLPSEDERKVESETVENQIEFLKNFISKDASLVLTEEYVDRN